MVEQEYEHLQPRLEDPMPADLDNLFKNILLTQRTHSFWSWSRESDWTYEYRKARQDRARVEAEMARARRIHGL